MIYMEKEIETNNEGDVGEKEEEKHIENGLNEQSHMPKKRRRLPGKKETIPLQNRRRSVRKCAESNGVADYKALEAGGADENTNLVEGHEKKVSRRGRKKKMKKDENGEENLSRLKTKGVLSPSEDEVVHSTAEGPLTCHQCKRNDKGRVICCQMCQRKRFCIPCLKTWYILLNNFH